MVDMGIPRQGKHRKRCGKPIGNPRKMTDTFMVWKLHIELLYSLLEGYIRLMVVNEVLELCFLKKMAIARSMLIFNRVSI